MDRNSSEASIRSSEFLKTGLRTLVGWAGPTTGRRLLSFSNEKLSNSSEFLENWALRFSTLFAFSSDESSTPSSSSSSSWAESSDDKVRLRVSIDS
jgi:hypothetical protein